MKSLIILFTVISSFVSTSSSAMEPEVSRIAMENFQATFTDATDVKWTVGDTYYKADFQLNGQYASAYYDMEANELIATTRNLSSLQLPIALQASLKSDYQDFWVSELFEVSNEAGTHYYVTLENADNKLVLKSASFSDWKTYKKVSKA